MANQSEQNQVEFLKEIKSKAFAFIDENDVHGEIIPEGNGTAGAQFMTDFVQHLCDVGIIRIV